MAISVPWSQVIERARCSGRRTTLSDNTAATCSVVLFSTLMSMPSRVVRSTSVATALRPIAPTIRSPSQWPGTARSAASGGRSEMLTMPGICTRPEEVRVRGRRQARPDRRRRIPALVATPR